MELQLTNYLPILGATLFFVAFFLRKRSKSSLEPPLPPGPWMLPIIGNMHHLIGGLPFRKTREFSLRYGPFVRLKLGQVEMFVACSREAAEEVMKHQDLNFASRPQLDFAKIVAYGSDNISFAPYGPFWKQMRKVAAMELLSTKRVRSFGAMRREAVHHMLQSIAAQASESKPVNICKTLIELTNTVVSRAAFGEHLDSRFMPLIHETMGLVSGFDFADFFPSLKFLGVLSGVRFKLEKVHRQLDEIIDDIIKHHQLKRANSQTAISYDDEDLIDVLLRVKDQEDLEIPLTMDNIKAIILELFLGGTETSSAVIEWAMSELMRNPEVMEKAQKEVREVLKEKTKVEESDLGELSYLKMVLKEALRLHPPGPMLMARVSKETVQVLGYKVPAGTRVMTNVWALGRDPQYWEDPESFKPERFEGRQLDYRGFDFQFLPFGAGRRICPGMTFGMVIAELALAQLLFYFDWKLPHGMKPEDVDMTEAFGGTAPRKNDIELIATPRIPIPAF